MSQPHIFRDPLCRRWSELYAGWMSLAEAHNEERKNGWKPTENRLLLAILTGQESPSTK